MFQTPKKSPSPNNEKNPNPKKIRKKENEKETLSFKIQAITVGPCA